MILLSMILPEFFHIRIAPRSQKKSWQDGTEN
jgi:hypothetical protein